MSISPFYAFVSIFQRVAYILLGEHRGLVQTNDRIEPSTCVDDSDTPQTDLHRSHCIDC